MLKKKNSEVMKMCFMGKKRNRGLLHKIWQKWDHLLSWPSFVTNLRQTHCSELPGASVNFSRLPQLPEGRKLVVTESSWVRLQIRHFSYLILKVTWEGIILKRVFVNEEFGPRRGCRDWEASQSRSELLSVFMPPIVPLWYLCQFSSFKPGLTFNTHVT